MLRHEPLLELADGVLMSWISLLVDLPVDDVHLAPACSRDTPGLSRPTTVSQRLRRLSRSFHVGVICAFIIIGTMMSALVPTWRPLKPGALTPTIVIGCPLT